MFYAARMQYVTIIKERNVCVAGYYIIHWYINLAFYVCATVHSLL